MKCYLCLVHEARQGAYPAEPFLVRLGHNLNALREAILVDHFGGRDRAVIQDDYDFMQQDARLHDIIRILSDFGKFARYYNLDVVTGKAHQPIDPKAEWESLESSIEDPSQYLGQGRTEMLLHDYYPRVNSKIIAIIERFVRAIARQFTLGGHGGRLQQCMGIYSRFLHLRDDELGQTDYRRPTRVLRHTRHS